MNRALIVGIDKYQDYKKNLGGCVNDALSAANTLIRKYNYSEVLILKDSKATKEALLRELESLVSVTQPGDNAVFFYSGHGSQVPNVHGHELDTFDECLVTHDHSWSNPLIDDDIRYCLRNHKQGANICLIMDACHSGGLYDVNGIKADFVPPDIADAVANKTEKSVTRKIGKKNSDVDTQRHVLIAGCVEEGYSLERKIRGQKRGVLSFCLFDRICRHWKLFGSNNANGTYKVLGKNLSRMVLKFTNMRQAPVVLGSKTALRNKLFL
jgi:hypothetical protein